jgi:preprotein translocase subunit SecA
MRPGVDFDTDEGGRNVFLAEPGVDEAEKALECGNLMAAENVTLLASVRNALHAEHLLERDVDYIVRRGAVELVDEFTGRVAENRQWPDGLQAAVEAKEGLRLGADGRILGSLTLQHLLHLYPHLCGMTATARSAVRELREVYDLEVAVIPPHRPCIREDLPDLLYTHREARDRALLAEIARVHATGRPILVGTASVADSERLAAALGEHGIHCRVLNAKNDEEEAAVVAEAGALGAVTISTNMAGRGTDIRLGGHDERNRHEVVALGGLYVLGTHRHESVRIDRQLRGRAGRQGDPGSSRFYVSLDDELLERCGIARLIPEKLFPKDPDDRVDSPIDSPIVRREVARAQRIIEGQCADARRRLYEFSEILERQRELMATWRQELLEERERPGLLEERAGERWRRLRDELGDPAVQDVERRLTLLVLDRCWSEHLTEMQAVRDEVHLVALDGRLPIAEFYRTAIAAFEELLERIDDETVAAFERLAIGRDGRPDWDEAGLRGPSATWTYLVHDDVFGGNLFLGLSNRASIGLWAVLLLWPVLLAWGIYLRWKRRKEGEE